MNRRPHRNLTLDTAAGSRVDVLTDLDPGTDTAVLVDVNGGVLELTAREALRLGAAIMAATDTRTAAIPDVVDVATTHGTAFVRVALWTRPAAGTVCGVVDVLDPATVTVAAPKVGPIMGSR